MDKRLFVWIGFLFALIACNLGVSEPTPKMDLFATLAASTPLAASSSVETMTPPVPFFLVTPLPPTADRISPVANPQGRIVYTCQIFGSLSRSQICIINADGGGFQQLTSDDTRQHYYPSLSPDGKSIVYAAFRDGKFFEIYEMNLASGAAFQLTNKLGGLGSPEISPSGEAIIFSRFAPNINKNFIWWMTRRGEDADKISRFAGWEPTWSPDGKYILFVSDEEGAPRLYTSRFNGDELHRFGALNGVSGRPDWSPDGKWVVVSAGNPGKIYLMDADGANARVISPAGSDSREPSFSPDGEWVAFRLSFDNPGDPDVCEIYIMRLDGSDLRRLTTNDYCDSQPRWGR